MLKKISIIGFGLIGSSIAREIKKNKLAKIISACDVSNKALKEIKSLKLANEITNKLEVSVQNANLIFICTPLSTYEGIRRVDDNGLHRLVSRTKLDMRPLLEIPLDRRFTID